MGRAAHRHPRSRRASSEGPLRTAAIFTQGAAFGRTGLGKGSGLLRSDSASAANCGSTRVGVCLDQRGVDSLALSSSFDFSAPPGRRPPEEAFNGERSLSFMGATQTVGWIRSHGRKATAFALFALVLLTALAVASSSKAAVESPPPPSVSSDKADYAPGELVTLSGANWSPGEAVHIRVNDDAGETWRRDVDVTADESGVISDQFNLPDWFVATYTVTATGATSGTATWSFTDANYRFLSSGPTLSTLSWQLYSNSACTTVLTGTGTSGNPSFVTSGAGNRTICVTGEASNGLRRITANYAAPATVNTTMTATNASATYGDTSVTLAATVSPASGPAVNTGTVTFTVGGTSVTSGTVSGGNASATFSLSGVNAGSYSIAATY